VMSAARVMRWIASFATLHHKQKAAGEPAACHENPVATQ
jgi:hypothetical protein